MSVKFLPLLLLLGSMGCTHVQLRHNCVRQSATLSEIYQQQVLDNLAKFARDPYAMPHFATATGGTNAVNDSLSSTPTFNWNTFRFTGATLGANAGRQLQENWSLVAVNNPRKLELMRCAYQRALLSCHPETASCCPECEKRFNHFYTGNHKTPPPMPCSEDSPGTVNSNCLGTGWLHVGCEKCMHAHRKKNPCCLSGSYCGCCVWVTPGIGSDELTKLTIAILDYAINDPPPKPANPTKEVVAYLAADGSPALAHTASFIVRGTVSANADAPVVLSAHERAQSKYESDAQEAGEPFEFQGEIALPPPREPIATPEPISNFDQLFQQQLFRALPPPQAP